ncbi:MAG: 3-dehydro-L-gulonate 2-dehydrogenase [Acidobacteriaceae bacterium]
MRMLRISCDELSDTLTRVLLKLGFEQAQAETCARLFTETTCDGIYSHGIDWFPRFVKMVCNGSIDVDASPVFAMKFGALERWDGRRGPGNLNAHQCMGRAIALSRENGVGCVALANTNHWMRGGTYGWQAADAGVIGVCWTNTMANLPPWGSTEPRLGNNPLVIAIPRPNGHVVLDMAMSQFSYGALASYRMRGELLPVEGGFDTGGQLTRDPAAIEESQRPLPIGYWKGSGLSLTLDMMAAMLSAGHATHQIPTDKLHETGLSQVFLAFDISVFGPGTAWEETADRIIKFVQAATHTSGGENLRYPGGRTLQTRAENRLLGIPVEPSLWDEIKKM